MIWKKLRGFQLNSWIVYLGMILPVPENYAGGREDPVLLFLLAWEKEG
jgi:hypothetical protein